MSGRQDSGERPPRPPGRSHTPSRAVNPPALQEPGPPPANPPVRPPTGRGPSGRQHRHAPSPIRRPTGHSGRLRAGFDSGKGWRGVRPRRRLRCGKAPRLPYVADTAPPPRRRRCGNQVPRPRSPCTPSYGSRAAPQAHPPHRSPCDALRGARRASGQGSARERLASPPAATALRLRVLSAAGEGIHLAALPVAATKGAMRLPRLDSQHWPFNRAVPAARFNDDWQTCLAEPGPVDAPGPARPFLPEPRAAACTPSCGALATPQAHPRAPFDALRGARRASGQGSARGRTGGRHAPLTTSRQHAPFNRAAPGSFNDDWLCLAEPGPVDAPGPAKPFLPSPAKPLYAFLRVTGRPAGTPARTRAPFGALRGAQRAVGQDALRGEGRSGSTRAQPSGRRRPACLHRALPPRGSRRSCPARWPRDVTS